MNKRKILSIILINILIFNVCGFNVFAVEDDSLSTMDSEVFYLFDDYFKDSGVANSNGELEIEFEQQEISDENLSVSIVGNTQNGIYDDSGNPILEKYTVFKGTSSFSVDASVEINGKKYNTYKAGNRPDNIYTLDHIPTYGEGSCLVLRPKHFLNFTVYAWGTYGKQALFYDFSEETDSSPVKTPFNESEDGVAYDYILVKHTFTLQPKHIYVISTSGQTNNFSYAGYSYNLTEENIDIETSTETTTEDTTEVTTLSPSILSNSEYTYDLRQLTFNTDYTVGVESEDGNFKITSSEGHYAGINSGFYFHTGDTIEVNVEGNADITFASSSGKIYSNIEVSSSRQGFIEEFTPYNLAYNSESADIIYEYTGQSDRLIFKLNGSCYIAYINVVNYAHRDFQEIFDKKFKDNIITGGAIEFEPQEFNYNGTTVSLLGYGEQPFTNEMGNTVIVDGEEYTAFNAGTYLKNLSMNNYIERYNGEGCGIVIKPNYKGMFTIYVNNPNNRITAYEYDEYDYFSGTYTRKQYEQDSSTFSFPVLPGYKYIVTSLGSKNTFYGGYKAVKYDRINIPISSIIKSDSSSDFFAGEKFILKDVITEKEYNIAYETDSITLYKEHTYTIEAENTAIIVTFKDGKQTFTAKTDEKLELELTEIPKIEVSGSFVTNDDIIPNVRELWFKNDLTNERYDAQLTDDGMGYVATLHPGTYTTYVAATEHDTNDHVKVESDDTAITNDIYLESLYTGHYILPEEISKDYSALSFESLNSTIQTNGPNSIRAYKGDKITVPVKGVQKVTVAGYYSGTWDINGQNSVTTSNDINYKDPTCNSYITDGTETEVVVNITGEGTNYLYWIEVVDINNFNGNSNVLTVPSEKFPTVSSAVDYIKTIIDRPEGEEGRIVIDLTDDIREQVLIDTPFVTINGNGHSLSWYYGSGAYYYSVDTNGFYSETLLRDRCYANEGAISGVLIIKSNNFLAENLTVKNTHCFETTIKENEDLASDKGSNDFSNISTAIIVCGSNTEFYNCHIIASRFVIYARGSRDEQNLYSLYCKDCIIEGSHSLICNMINEVYDNCEFRWINTNMYTVYLMYIGNNKCVLRGCTINSTQENTPINGYYGCTMSSAPAPSVIFIQNEVNGNIQNGWDYDNAMLYEYYNTSNGCFFKGGGDLSADLPDDFVSKYTTEKIIDEVLGGWMPKHYSFELQPPEEDIKPASFYDDNVINFSQLYGAGKRTVANEEALSDIVTISHNKTTDLEIFQFIEDAGDDWGYALTLPAGNESIATDCQVGDIVDLTEVNSAIKISATNDLTSTIIAYSNGSKSRCYMVNSNGEIVKTFSLSATSDKIINLKVSEPDDYYIFAPGGNAEFPLMEISTSEFVITDIDGDGKWTEQDATDLLKYFSGTLQLTENGIKNADCDNVEGLNLLDVIKILKYKE